MDQVTLPEKMAAKIITSYKNKNKNFYKGESYNDNLIHAEF